MGKDVLDKLAADHMKKMEADIERQLTDALTFGTGFTRQTNFPPKVEHVPYMGIFRKDVV